MTEDNYYEIIDGEHRWVIAKELGWKTIDAIVRQADDLQARAYCISYNKWRGRFNWFKLYDVIKHDQDNGINIEQAYKDALTQKELKYLLTLNNLSVKARLNLEESLKKHPEYTLEQLYILSKFPQTQQEHLSETYQKPISTHFLTRILTSFLQQNQPNPNTPTKNTNPWLPNNNDTQNQSFNPNSISSSSGDYGSKGFMKQPGSLYSKSSNDNSNDEEGELDDFALQTGDSDSEGARRARKDRVASLLAVGYNCDCGRLYHVHFKKMHVAAQKENLLFEHIDFKKRTFLVHCDQCDNDHEFTVDSVEAENGVVSIFCCRCDPNRKGLLDATGEVTWL